MKTPLHMNEEDLARMNKVLRHRLRNTASGLKASVSFLAKGLGDRLTPQEKEYFPLILNECDKLTELTGRLQLALGETVEKGPPCRLADVVESALTDVRNDLPTARIDLDMPAELSGVPVTYRQALLVPLIELLRNALDAAPGGVVHLRAGRTETHMTLSIADGGPGADPALFEHPRPFHTTRTRRLGLGLFVARRHIGFLDGWIEQQPGEPAHTVRMLWPLQ